MTKKILKTYYLILFLFNLTHFFFAATYVLFLTSKGMNLLQVNLINLVFMISVFIFEIPTGAFADTLGRKRSFVIACFVFSLGMLVYFLSQDFWSFILAEIILALACTFSSGAFQAWLVDGLKYYNFKGSFDRVFSKEQQIRNVAVVISGLSGAYIGRYNLAMPWLVASIGIFLVGILAQILMREEHFKKERFQIRKTGIRIKDIAIRSIKYGIKNKVVLMIICFGAIQFFAVQAPNMYWQLRFNEFVSDRYLLGWIFATCYLAIAGGNRLAVFILRIVKRKKLGLLISQVFAGLFLFLASLFSSLTPILFFILLNEMSRGVFDPIKSVYLNKNIPSDKRATIISFDSMASKIGSAAGLLVSGILAKNISISFSWLFSGIFLIFATVIIFLFSRRID